MKSIHIVSVKDFIHASNPGRIDLELSKRNLSRLCEVWRDSAECNVLVDGRDSIYDFSPQDIGEIVSVVFDAGLGKENCVALLYRKREPFDKVKFFEFLANRKGLRIKAFEEFEDAIDWLSTRRPATAA